MPLPEAVSNRLIGELFVARGLVSQSQLLVALELQQETGQQLGQILVERFGVERSDLAKVVAEHWARLGEAEEQATTRASESWRQLGEILVDRGFVTREQLVQALERQRQTGERLGEALIGQGVLSKFELAGSLAEQSSAVSDPDNAQTEPARVVPLLRPGFGFARHEPGDPAEPEPDAVREQYPGEWSAAELAEVVADPEVVPEQEVAAQAEPEPEFEPEFEPEPEVEPEPEPDLEPRAEAEHEDAHGPERATMPEARPAVTLVPEPAAAAEGEHEAASDRDAHVPDAPHEEHAVAAYVAFASTPRGYRLLTLEDRAVPEVGERVVLPELGELVVMHRGVSPLPCDERTCLFLEPPVPAAHAG